METQAREHGQTRPPRNIPYSCQRGLEAVSEELKLLTTEESMEVLGVSRGTFWKMIKRHGLTCYTLPTCGKRVFFTLEDLESLMQPQRRAHNTSFRSPSQVEHDFGVRATPRAKKPSQLSGAEDESQ